MTTSPLQRRLRLQSTLGQLLLADAIDYRGALTKSVSECTIANGTTGFRCSCPHMHVNATPYVDMTTNREASYANFRFWSETLMAEQMPSAVEAMWLRWHNEEAAALAAPRTSSSGLTTCLLQAGASAH